MRRIPEPVPVENFEEPIRRFIELDREIMNYLFENRSEEIADVVWKEDFLSRASAAFSEEQSSWYREITFGDFVLETLEIYAF